ncbi:MAG: hypothetical protein ACI92S_005030 [Planctomycetaceae bacterium]
MVDRQSDRVAKVWQPSRWRFRSMWSWLRSDLGID